MARPTATGPVRARHANKWVALSVISVGTLASTLDGGGVSVAFPALAEAFSSDASTVLWVSVAFWVTSVGLLLSLGWLGDVAGRRRVFTLGSLVFGLGLAAVAGSFSLWQVIGARIVQGIGSSMMLSNLNALITASFPSSERGKAMGISGAVVGVGLTGGPLLGGALLDALGWRSLFYSRAPLGLIGAALAWRLLPPDSVPGDRARMDLTGAALLFAVMASFLLFVNQGSVLGYGSPPIIGLAVAAAALAPVLVWSQLRSVRPVLDFALFKSRQYTFALLVLTSHYLSHGVIILVAPFFFIDALDFSPTRMGLFLAAFYAGRTVLAPMSGRLSDVFGPRPFLVLGNLLLALGLFWLSRGGADVAEWTLLSGLLLAGAGSAFFEPVVTSVIMGSVPEDRLGTASASVAMGRHIAFAVGVAVAGAIFAVRERVYLADLAFKSVGADTAAREAIAGAFGDALLAGVVLALVAVAFSFGTRPPKIVREV